MQSILSDQSHQTYLSFYLVDQLIRVTVLAWLKSIMIMALCFSSWASHHHLCDIIKSSPRGPSLFPLSARQVPKITPKRTPGVTMHSPSDCGSPSQEFSPGDPLECLTLDLASTKNVSQLGVSSCPTLCCFVFLEYFAFFPGGIPLLRINVFVKV